MKEKYVISIDQSTQGTKALLFNQSGQLIAREDLAHKQLVNELGWISHDPEEIYLNTLAVVKKLIDRTKIDKSAVISMGISNQRETSVIWDRKTGKALAPAIVWQCSRARDICEIAEIKSSAEVIRQKTGLPLSPYFPAAKIAWLLKCPEISEAVSKGTDIAHGTIDTWLLFKLTGNKEYKTDYSNASRTQLFNILDLKWDKEICELFGIKAEDMAEVVDSNSVFGYTKLDGYLDEPLPINAIMGDSHAALYGQACLNRGLVKATYGTGSSVMMNTGSQAIFSDKGIVTSLAWSIDGRINYVLEGNINATGSVITWLKNDLQLISSASETEQLAYAAKSEDSLYLVPAFTGLGAPYWSSEARAAVVGMDRTTGKKEFVRSALECIAYQIADIVQLMEEDSGINIESLKVDGGPTKNKYLIQFQSDILGVKVAVPSSEELSGIGVAYMSGIGVAIWDYGLLHKQQREEYCPNMVRAVANNKVKGWKSAVEMVLPKT